MFETVLHWQDFFWIVVIVASIAFISVIAVNVHTREVDRHAAIRQHHVALKLEGIQQQLSDGFGALWEARKADHGDAYDDG